jgi:tetratricopeptide (TPR) repeat protein
MRVTSWIWIFLLALGVGGCGVDTQSVEKQARSALALLDEGEVGEAESVSRRILHSLEANALVQELAGRVALARMRPSEAVTHFKNAIDLEDRPRRRGLLGRALLGVGRLDDAADALEDALSQQGDSPRLLMDAVYVYSRTGRTREALEIARRLLILDGSSPAAQVRVASAYLRAGKSHREEARNLLRTLDMSLLQDVEDLVLLGSTLYELGEGPRAVRALSRANEMVPGTPELLYNLGTARMLTEDYRRAKKDFDQLLKQRPSDALARGQLAYCLSQMGRKESARKELQRARQLAPQDQVLRLMEEEFSK